MMTIVNFWISFRFFKFLWISLNFLKFHRFSHKCHISMFCDYNYSYYSAQWRSFRLMQIKACCPLLPRAVAWNFSDLLYQPLLYLPNNPKWSNHTKNHPNFIGYSQAHHRQIWLILNKYVIIVWGQYLWWSKIDF